MTDTNTQTTTHVNIPDFGLVMLIGPTGAGKSTFAAKHFRPSEVLSSDHYRSVVGDDEHTYRTTKDAFDAMAYVAGKRLAARRVAVVDATNLYKEHRGAFTALAHRHHAPFTGVVFDLSESVCQRHNALRPDPRPRHVVRQQWHALRRGMKSLSKEGFRRRFRLRTPEEAAGAEVLRKPLPCDRRDLTGTFDVIGDVHGCEAEMIALLAKLGYAVNAGTGEDAEARLAVTHPEGRTAVFVGDLVDRGPSSTGVLRIVMDMVEQGIALVVQGNHDNKLGRALAGRNVQRTHGLAETMAALEAGPEELRTRVRRFIETGMATHYVLDSGKLVVAHAGMTEDLQNRAGGGVREFGLYGDSTGDTDDDGEPLRGDWAKDYRGQASVVYGHTAVREPKWVNSTLCIDTGCAWGGSLTALRYPERELASVPAGAAYAEPMPKAMREPARGNGTAQQAADHALDLEDVQGLLRIHTRLNGVVTIKPENSAMALETMSRFAVDPRWLIYLPPTMAPSQAAEEGELLERPAEAFDHFRKRGVERIICQEKHMGSRAIVVVAQDAGTAKRRFGIASPNGGIVYTRTGRPFFDDPDTELKVLDRFRRAFDRTNLWNALDTDWACLDCEIMPWNAKGRGLVKRHYTPVATAARMGLAEARHQIKLACVRDPSHEELLAGIDERTRMTAAYDIAYQRYNWPVESVDDLRIAPFHLMATEGAVHADKTNLWHMQQLGALCRDDNVLRTTTHHVVEVNDESQVRRATDWWTDTTGTGAEGMVVKPLDFVTRGERGLMTPGVKCRGREYLRIIYGPEYTDPGQISRLRKRSVGGKMALSIREFALGIEALEQFVSRAPLRKVHQAVFGVLALEAEPLDPRL